MFPLNKKISVLDWAQGLIGLLDTRHILQQNIQFSSLDIH